MKDFTFHIFSTKVDSKEDETNLAKSELALEKYISQRLQTFSTNMCVSLVFVFAKKTRKSKVIEYFVGI